MATSEIEQWWIDKFQENLGPIRKVAGWTTQQLADELGVARQTVSNLETGKSPMTKLQYLALLKISLVLRNAQNAIIYGDIAFVDWPGNGRSTPFSITVYDLPKYVSYDLYAQIW